MTPLHVREVSVHKKHHPSILIAIDTIDILDCPRIYVHHASLCQSIFGLLRHYGHPYCPGIHIHHVTLNQSILRHYGHPGIVPGSTYIMPASARVSLDSLDTIDILGLSRDHIHHARVSLDSLDTMDILGLSRKGRCPRDVQLYASKGLLLIVMLWYEECSNLYKRQLQ